jgi:hypothetical protein
MEDDGDNGSGGGDKEASSPGEATVLSFSVSPLLATLILHFDDDDEDDNGMKEGGGAGGAGGGSTPSPPQQRTASELALLTGLPEIQVSKWEW